MSVYSNESAWRYNAARGACYLAQFREEQPELNLESEYVQGELEAILQFWLERGVDGFRVNSVAFLYENQDLTNERFLDDTCDSNNPTVSSTSRFPWLQKRMVGVLESRWLPHSLIGISPSKSKSWPVAGPEFPRPGGQPWVWDKNLLFNNIFPENCMKMKENATREGHP